MRTRNVDFVLVGITESNPPCTLYYPQKSPQSLRGPAKRRPLSVLPLNITAIPTRPSKAPAPISTTPKNHRNPYVAQQGAGPLSALPLKQTVTPHPAKQSAGPYQHTPQDRP
jgi:hypothetical protein